VAERIDIRGKPYLRFECECGQRQQTPEPGEGKDPQVKCARCGKEHQADG